MSHDNCPAGPLRNATITKKAETCSELFLCGQEQQPGITAGIAASHEDPEHSDKAGIFHRHYRDAKVIDSALGIYTKADCSRKDNGTADAWIQFESADGEAFCDKIDRVGERSEASHDSAAVAPHIMSETRKDQDFCKKDSLLERLDTRQQRLNTLLSRGSPVLDIPAPSKRPHKMTPLPKIFSLSSSTTKPSSARRASSNRPDHDLEESFTLQGSPFDIEFVGAECPSGASPSMSVPPVLVLAPILDKSRPLLRSGSAGALSAADSSTFPASRCHFGTSSEMKQLDQGAQDRSETSTARDATERPSFRDGTRDSTVELVETPVAPDCEGISFRETKRGSLDAIYDHPNSIMDINGMEFKDDLCDVPCLRVEELQSVCENQGKPASEYFVSPKWENCIDFGRRTIISQEVTLLGTPQNMETSNMEPEQHPLSDIPSVHGERLAITLTPSDGGEHGQRENSTELETSSQVENEILFKSQSTTPPSKVAEDERSLEDIPNKPAEALQSAEVQHAVPHSITQWKNVEKCRRSTTIYNAPGAQAQIIPAGSVGAEILEQIASGSDTSLPSANRDPVHAEAAPLQLLETRGSPGERRSSVIACSPDSSWASPTGVISLENLAVRRATTARIAAETSQENLFVMESPQDISTVERSSPFYEESWNLTPLTLSEAMVERSGVARVDDEPESINHQLTVIRSMLRNGMTASRVVSHVRGLSASLNASRAKSGSSLTSSESSSQKSGADLEVCPTETQHEPEDGATECNGGSETESNGVGDANASQEVILEDAPTIRTPEKVHS